MRSAIVTSPKGLSVRGIAGTYVVLLSFDCSKSYRKDLLGFGIERKDHENGEVSWLRGLKKFDLPNSDEGDDVTTRRHPIQKFHWGDYTAKPGREYTYTVHAFKGSPTALQDFDSAEVKVKCEVPDRVGDNGHRVHFNRSAAASQAFARRFPSMPPGDVEDPAARTWLSRGLMEALIAYIDGAQKNEGLHLFVYEFAKKEYFEALRRAKERGVRLEIIYDAIIKTVKNKKTGEVKKTGPSLESEHLIKTFGLKAVAKGRDPSGINISHNKFMVLTGKDGKPKSVWTGSTNFTDSGVYAQTNVGHVIVGREPAQAYFDWHQAIFDDPHMSATDSRKQAMTLSSVPKGKPSGTMLVLSPRKTIEAVTACAKLVSGGKRMVCFTAPFQLHQDIETALIKAPSQVFGLLNTNSVVSEKLHDAENTQLAAAGAINEKSILEVWQKKLQEESMQHSGVFIHTKIIMIDPLSDNPIIITGSANFSNNSSKNNDENQLFIAGETAVADVYLGEFMRMFDHYYFRDVAKAMAKLKKQDPKAGFLDESDGWSGRYFDGGDRQAQRLAFFP
jgi:phosphatidylserine/phosphatidylglycerophosphate/cardiolipin synthase-like enzyme